MAYPHWWSPISCRSSAGQGKFAGQRPTFYHCATPPTGRVSLQLAIKEKITDLKSPLRQHIGRYSRLLRWKVLFSGCLHFLALRYDAFLGLCNDQLLEIFAELDVEQTELLRQRSPVQCLPGASWSHDQQANGRRLYITENSTDFIASNSRHVTNGQLTSLHKLFLVRHGYESSFSKF